MNCENLNSGWTNYDCYCYVTSCYDSNLSDWTKQSCCLNYGSTKIDWSLNANCYYGCYCCANLSCDWMIPSCYWNCVSCSNGCLKLNCYCLNGCYSNAMNLPNYCCCCASLKLNWKNLNDSMIPSYCCSNVNC